MRTDCLTHADRSEITFNLIITRVIQITRHLATELAQSFLRLTALIYSKQMYCPSQTLYLDTSGIFSNGVGIYPPFYLFITTQIRGGAINFL